MRLEEFQAEEMTAATDGGEVMAETKNAIMIVDEQSLRDKIHVIRSQQVILDYDLAEIYGYETRYLNLQVKHNINRFPDDFMFQLTKEEFENLTLKKSTSSHGGRRRPPFAFTEQGVYQLATVLKGEVAEGQSVAIMRVFRAMREYISQHRQLVPQQELLLLSGKQALLESKVRDIKENMVTRAELSDFMRLFDSRIEHEEILILDGEPFKADVAYQKIYGKAKRKIIIVDDYIGVKTLLHLAHAKANAVLTVISDNKARPPLRQAEYHDYLTENPGRNITFIQSAGRSHDRYIVLDEGTMDMKVYHCGASSKDAGKKITTITRLTDIDDYKNTIHTLLGNPPLVLR